MPKLIALFDKSQALLPSKEALKEATGYLVLGSGLLLGLSIYTFHPSDYHAVGTVQNLAGPVGAALAHMALSSLGLVTIIWPILLIIYGAAMIIGLNWTIHPKRVVGFMASSLILASLCFVVLTSYQFAKPSFGFGGSIGDTFGAAALRHFGFGGASIILTVLALISLAITGNIAVSRLRALTQFAWTRSKAYAKNAIELFKGEDQVSDEDLIRQALIAEIKQSTSLGKKKAVTTSTSESKASVKKVALAKIDLEAIAEDAMNEIEADEASVETTTKLNFYYEGKSHGRPEASLFTRSTKAKERGEEFKKMGDKLTKQLSQFKVDGRINKIVEGPVVTTYEFEPVAGTKVSKITGLAQDLARMLQANSLRILAPIPGKKVVGFEVPNAERRTIGFADLVAHRDLKSSKIQLPVAMGVDAFGTVVIEDLAKMPHLLVAGSTGSGKSVFMNTLIGGLIARHTAKDLRFVMIDPKMVELAAYNGLPHMACPVITDPAGEAKEKLDAMVAEMEDRFRKMQQVGARNIQGFNEIIKKGRRTDHPSFVDKWQTMPFIVLIIDELADMMMVLGKDAEIPITRLAQKARAAGIHLVIATQRPSAEVVTGLIKANFPTRIAFRVLSGLDSRTILDTSGAEAMIGQGDMLFLNAMGLRRMHGAYLSDGEVQAMVKACK